jgi:hypothetical protein
VKIRFDRKDSARWLTFALMTAALHFVWEMGQGGWFASTDRFSFWRATFLCARATVGDVVITAAAFAIAATAARSLHWPAENIQWFPVAIFITSGLAVTVAYEIHALAVREWSYAQTMPTIAGVGLLPILQWLVIPITELAVFRLLWRSRV